KADIEKIKIFFRERKQFNDFSYYYAKMPREDKEAMEVQLKTPFIISYESCKGLEFDTVIMPFFQKASWALTTAKRDDNDNIQLNADGTTKTICTKNHFYVASTRAKKNLYIFYDWNTNIFNDFNTPVYKLNGEF